MHPPSRRSVLTRFVSAVAASSLLAVAVISSPAGAHEGTAVITVESQTVEGTSVDYVVRAVWDNDGHAAADATATVVADSPTGERLGPVPMEPTDDDGRYTATLDFPSPGDWNVRFTVVTPPGTLEITQTVPSTDAPVATTETTADPEQSATSAAADVEATDSTAPLDAEPASASAAEERPTSNAGAALFFFIVAAIILGACLLAYRSRGTRQAQQQASRTTTTDETTDPGDTTDGATSPSDSSIGEDGADTAVAGDSTIDTGGGTTD